MDFHACGRFGPHSSTSEDQRFPWCDNSNACREEQQRINNIGRNVQGLHRNYNVSVGGNSHQNVGSVQYMIPQGNPYWDHAGPDQNQAPPVMRSTDNCVNNATFPASNQLQMYPTASPNNNLSPAAAFLWESHAIDACHSRTRSSTNTDGQFLLELEGDNFKVNEAARTDSSCYSATSYLSSPTGDSDHAKTSSPSSRASERRTKRSGDDQRESRKQGKTSAERSRKYRARMKQTIETLQTKSQDFDEVKQENVLLKKFREEDKIKIDSLTRANEKLRNEVLELRHYIDEKLKISNHQRNAVVCSNSTVAAPVTRTTMPNQSEIPPNTMVPQRLLDMLSRTSVTRSEVDVVRA